MNVLILNPYLENEKNVVRDLIYGCWCRGKRIGGTQIPPLSLLHVATVLRDDNHKIDLIDASLNSDLFDRCLKNIREYGAVIILTSTHSFSLDVKVLRLLKTANPLLKTIIYGSHPTYMPQYCLKEESIDFIILREPEFIIKDLISALDKNYSWQKIKGIGYRDKGKIIINPYYPYVENLDQLPIPDRKLLPKNAYYFNPLAKRMPFTTMYTSWGCPGKCNFCTVPSFYGTKFRAFSAERVIKELKIIRKLEYREVFFRDETFTTFKKRNREICEAIIKEGIDISWVCNSRVDTIDREMILLMKKAGCHLIKFGVESGDQNILNNINKGTTIDQAINIFKWAHELGMDTHAHFMLGCPGETSETIRRTIDFAKKLDPTTASFAIHTPYPGTKLFAQVAKMYPEIRDGAACNMERIHTTGFFNQAFTRLSTKELEEAVKKAYREFYFRPKYIFSRIKSMTNLEELKRTVKAGLMILTFGIKGEE